MTATSTLITHAGAHLVTRQQLRGIETPPSTSTHRPIAHADLVDLLGHHLANAGYSIARESYAVMSKGLKLFGVMDLNGGGLLREGTSLALGFRHANDAHMAVNLVAGNRVTVCDNMLLAGDVKVFKQHHRHGVIERLSESLGVFCQSYLKLEFQALETRIAGWAQTGLSDDQAKVLIYDMLATGVIPGRLRADVHTAYFDADSLGYEDSRERTLWGLSNACTRSFKALNPAPAYAANLGMTRLFDTVAA